ncbi:MerR family transcriptional regulator [Thiohalocapsa marina]|uniref:MerR family transcriptional regulator n=1 Tax=Thiohalocapsa marina TaxID=424902 RepID=A0A5M8FQV5_9GAMM|nr:chaperone modulator CbpM [Thiohalocapsa marina]KAA6186600.1 MerR family transcriptional regulator [Thiohalocapsa marina]
MAQHETGIEGVLLDEQTRVSITEMTRVCGVSVEQVRLMVGEGLLQPGGGAGPDNWSFSGVEVRRARRALRLQHDLELNLAGAALALELLEEVEQLRRRVRALEQQHGVICEVD